MKTIYALHQRLSRFDAVLTEWGGSLMSLIIRCYVGAQFFKAGMVKVSDWGATLSLFQNVGKMALVREQEA